MTANVSFKVDLLIYHFIFYLLENSNYQRNPRPPNYYHNQPQYPLLIDLLNMKQLISLLLMNQLDKCTEELIKVNTVTVDRHRYRQLLRDNIEITVIQGKGKGIIIIGKAGTDPDHPIEDIVIKYREVLNKKRFYS